MHVGSIQFLARTSDPVRGSSGLEMHESRSRKFPGGPSIRKIVIEGLHVIVIMSDFHLIIQGQFSGKLRFP